MEQRFADEDGPGGVGVGTFKNLQEPSRITGDSCTPWCLDKPPSSQHIPLITLFPSLGKLLLSGAGSTSVQETNLDMTCGKVGGKNECIYFVGTEISSNVRGELVFSVVAAAWCYEKSGWIGKVEDVKLVLFKKNGFQPATILRRRIFTRMNYELWFV
jgi:hypothetical protein